MIKKDLKKTVGDLGRFTTKAVAITLVFYKNYKQTRRAGMTT